MSPTFRLLFRASLAERAAAAEHILRSQTKLFTNYERYVCRRHISPHLGPLPVYLPRRSKHSAAALSVCARAANVKFGISWPRMKRISGRGNEKCFRYVSWIALATDGFIELTIFVQLNVRPFPPAFIISFSFARSSIARCPPLFVFHFVSNEKISELPTVPRL